MCDAAKRNLSGDVCGAAKETWRRIRTSPNMVLQLLGTMFGLAALCVAIVLLEPSLRVTKLAEWTAAKDYLEYCSSKRDANITLGPMCVAALNETLHPPPLPQSTSSALQQMGRYRSSPDLTDNEHHLGINPSALVVLIFLGLLLFCLITFYTYIFLSMRLAQDKEYQELESGIDPSNDIPLQEHVESPEVNGRIHAGDNPQVHNDNDPWDHPRPAPLKVFVNNTGKFFSRTLPETMHNAFNSIPFKAAAEGAENLRREGVARISGLFAKSKAS